jgi:hypothetical protein
VTLEAAGREADARQILRRFGGDLGSVSVGEDELITAAPVPSYSTTSGAMTGGAFPGAPVEERTVWGAVSDATRRTAAAVGATANRSELQWDERPS